MADDPAFLHAVCADPDDDGPRLVFADWLDERGDPRGEFIRLQVKLSRYRHADSRRPGWQDRAERLWADHGRAWLAQLPAIPGVTWLPTFRRGFADSLRTTIPVFLTRAEDWRTVAPVQRMELNVHWCDPELLERLVDDRNLSSIRTLCLDGVGYLNAPLRALVRFRHLTRMTCLSLLHAGLRAAAGLGELLEAPVFPEWDQLSLSGSREFSAEAIAVLARSPGSARLRQLDLGGCFVGDAGIRQLAESPHLSRLEILHLESSRLTEDGTYWLTHSPTFANLKRLRVWAAESLDNPARRALLKRFGKAALA